MKILFDYDSFIYASCYRICTIQDIRKWISMNRSREWMENEIVILSVNRVSNMMDNLLVSLEDIGLDVELADIEYYITECKKSIRKEIYPEYKANRQKNKLGKWVTKVRKYLTSLDYVIYDDMYEADDLIADRAREIGLSNCIILTIDKDLKQIGGLYFDYYKKPLLDSDGNMVFDEYGKPIKVFKGLEVVSQDEAKRIFWTSMLVGDSTDNIKGIRGIGTVKARKLIDKARTEDLEGIVKGVYLKVYDGLEEFKINYRLLYLGKELDIVYE